MRLRSPSGRVTKRSFRLPRQTALRKRVRLSMRVPAPQLWKPEDPKLYSSRIVLRDRGAVQQVDRRSVGLRSVKVKHGMLYLNNRRIELSGASIHEDMPGDGAALTAADMDRIVADLKEVGANVTRAHYLLNEGLLKRLDRAGIMVWSQAPIWQRDRRANVLRQPLQRRRAWETVHRTVLAARNHPSVITHSVANELWSRPDDRPNVTKRYLRARAGDRARHRPDAADLGRHQRPPLPPGAVHLPQVRHARDQPVLRLVPLGRELRRPAALPAGDARPVSRTSRWS